MCVCKALLRVVNDLWHEFRRVGCVVSLVTTRGQNAHDVMYGTGAGGRVSVDGGNVSIDGASGSYVTQRKGTG